MVFFGYATDGRFTPGLALHVVDRDGLLTSSQTFAAPFASMVHDFAVTDDWIVVPVFPLTGSMERAVAGAPPYAWEPDKGTHVALVPRHGSVRDALWFDAEPCYAFHVMNAFDTPDGKVVCDMMKYPVAPLFPLPNGRRSSEQSPVSTLVRWTFDPKGSSRRFSETPLDDHPGEFPRLDERFTGLPYRHGYFQAGAVTDAGEGRPARNGLAHIDHASGDVTLWRPGSGDYCGEPVFVPLHPTAHEGEGFLLSVIFRAATQCSDLAVFDARRVADGPLALAHLSHRVPAGFHGNWRDAAA
jgi:carotenoid cleavage dioxygenase